eukprot:scaffold43501_cov71-Phaeocystis_antarctica.AAC.2
MVFRAPRAKAIGADVVFVLEGAWLDLARLTCLPALMRTGYPTLQRDSCRCDLIALWLDSCRCHAVVRQLGLPLLASRVFFSVLIYIPASRRFGVMAADVISL